VVTLGTGKTVAEDLGGELVPSHSYAVTGQSHSSRARLAQQALTAVLDADLREVDGQRRIEIVNPWPTLSRQQNDDGQWTADLRNALPPQGESETSIGPFPMLSSDVASSAQIASRSRSSGTRSLPTSTRCTSTGTRLASATRTGCTAPWLAGGDRRGRRAGRRLACSSSLTLHR
jgi:hypothetical protein